MNAANIFWKREFVLADNVAVISELDFLSVHKLSISVDYFHRNFSYKYAPITLCVQNALEDVSSI